MRQEGMGDGYTNTDAQQLCILISYSVLHPAGNMQTQNRINAYKCNRKEEKKTILIILWIAEK